MQNPAYFLRFLDVLKSPEGEPLLNQLLASEDKLAALLPPPAPGTAPLLPILSGTHLLPIQVWS